MALNKPDRRDVEKQAEQRGYSWNSDGSKMTSKDGGSLSFSSSGGSVNINGSRYNSSSDAKKSSKW